MEPEPCERCDGPGEEPHSCPFAEEINNNYEELCNCCGDCEQQCAWDI